MPKRSPGLNLNQLGHKAPPRPSPAPVDTSFSSFSQYINLAGELNFADKAVINEQGVNFNNGICYKLNSRELDLFEELGRGRYGVVRKVFHKPTGVVMAMKEIRLELDEISFKQIITELDILHNGRSPYIVDFYGAFFSESCVYYCMEFMDYGSLDHLYAAGVPEDVLAKITLSVVKGLRFLKSELSIIHRDVKPTNILVNAKGEVKLCDFGVSGKLNQSLAKTHVGCQSYMAPERITSSKDRGYGIQSDVWSLGLTIIEISEARYPYDMSKCNSIFAQLEMLVHGPAPTLDGSRYSGDACDFVARCLQKDPDKRPNYTELLSHPWLVKHESCHVDLAAWARNAYEATDGHPPSQPRMD